MGDRYGRYQDLECRSLKGALLDLEAGDTGRVPLSAFYRAGLSGKWLFNEEVGYLRELGALDDSDPQELRVIVPNYLNSPSNCLAGSGFYDVCCIDECHALLHQLEHKIASPSAEPGRIASLVAALPSDTVDSPRNLSMPLLQRLGEIATVHGGRVPLHGRLFAQWMHHAYPRECPFPHVAGTTVPRSSAERAAAVGTDASASQEVMEMYAATSTDTGRAAASEAPPALPWLDVEELLTGPPAGRHWLWGAGQRLAALAAFSSMALAMARTLVSAKASVQGGKSDGYLV